MSENGFESKVHPSRLTDEKLTSILRRMPDDKEAVGLVWMHFESCMLEAANIYLRQKDVAPNIATADSVYGSAFGRILSHCRKNPKRLVDMGRDDFAGYLWRVMENIIKNRLEKRRPQLLPEGLEKTESDQHIFEEIAFKETLFAIRDRIDDQCQNPNQAERMKTVLALRLCHHTYREIADHLGIVPKSAENMGKILRKIIRPLIDGLEDE